MTDTAHGRVRAFLDRRSQIRGVDQEDIVSLDGVAHVLTTADLRTLVLQAEALHHAAPHAAQAIEMGPS